MKMPIKNTGIKLFPVPIFIFTFLTLGLFTALVILLIGDSIDISAIPIKNRIAVVILWVVLSAAFTWLTSWQIRDRYQKPIEEFAEAAKKVANGDFSVYVPLRHTPDKMDSLDIIFTDFNKMVEELGSIETLKTDFFSGVSHEIKTPVAVIQNTAELLKKTEINDERRNEYINTILISTKKLSELITNMLKLSKLEKQAIKPNPEPFDICAQLCECALQFEDIWDKKNIEFIAELEDSATVNADAGLLELVWTNLLSNALKFTPEGGTVTLTQTSEKNCITVTVADTGCGMDNETKKHIYDKFYQGDTSHATEGNGLGLALVHRVLELSDGSVSVQSTPGKGTVFTVRLPVGEV